jgi:gliding motility-associated-like protein
MTFKLIRLKLCLIILLMFCSAKVFSQQFYVNSSDAQLYLVTITPTGPVSTLVSGCGTGNYFSIAIYGSEIFYTSAYGTLYQGDLINGPVPSVANCKVLANNVSGNALTVDSKGVIYFAINNQIYSYDPKNPGVTTIGTMPYISGGDLAFYNNQLYMAAFQGIVKVDLGDPSKSTLYIPLPSQNVLGLATIKLNGADVMYALTSVGDSTNLIQLDMVNGVVTGNAGTLPYYVYDAGSTTENGVAPPVIMIDSIGIMHECDAYNRADVRVYLKPGTGNYTHTYSLSTGQTNTTGVFTGLAPATYQLYITSSGDEIAKDTSFTVPDYTVNNPAINASVVNPSCGNMGSIKLDAGTADSLYSIQYGQNTFKLGYTFAGLNAGTYNFTILNKQGCIIDERSYTLTQDTCHNIIIDSVQVKPACAVFGEADVTVFTSPHSDNYLYNFNNVTNTTGVFGPVMPGSYTLTISSSTGKQLMQTVIVPDFTANRPAITASSVNPACNNKGTIKLDAGAADSLYSIQYGQNIFNFSHSFAGLDAGTYSFTILNKQGCIVDERNYTLTQDTCPPIVLDSVQVKPTCNVFGGADVTVFAPPNTANYVYNFNNTTDTTGVFTAVKPGSYTLTITSSVGNQLTQTVMVPDFTANRPAISASVVNPVCDSKGTIKFDAGNAASFYSIQYGNDTFNLSHIFTGLAAGTYNFTILNKQGCIVDEKSYTLTQDTCHIIFLDSVQTKPTCDVFGEADVTIFTRSHLDNYVYNFNNETNTSGVFEQVKPGSYTLTISSSAGTQLMQTVTVPDYALSVPAVAYKVTDVVCTLLGTVKFTLTGNLHDAAQIKYGNHLFPLNQTITGLNSGNNHFIILNTQGCIVDTINVDVPFEECNPVVFPNTFTPNGDNINDVFRPKQDSDPYEYKLTIFNRWGALLFQSASFYTGWDGSYKGSPMPSGVYYWIAAYKSADGKKHTQSGYVTLIR